MNIQALREYIAVPLREYIAVPLRDRIAMSLVVGTLAPIMPTCLALSVMATDRVFRNLVQLIIGTTEEAQKRILGQELDVESVFKIISFFALLGGVLGFFYLDHPGQGGLANALIRRIPPVGFVP